MSKKDSTKQKNIGVHGGQSKLSAVKSSKLTTVKNNEQAMAMATSAARKAGGGAYRTAGKSSVQS